MVTLCYDGYLVLCCIEGFLVLCINDVTHLFEVLSNRGCGDMLRDSVLTLSYFLTCLQFYSVSSPNAFVNFYQCVPFQHFTLNTFYTEFK